LTNLPRGVVSSCLDGCPGCEIPAKSQNRSLEKIVSILDFRLENQILVITISTISMRRNCSISCLAAPGVANKKSSHLDPPRYNYDMQSMGDRPQQKHNRGQQKPQKKWLL
jgi:hypothetical protein